MAKAGDLHRTWLDDSAYRTAYDAMDGEFTLARARREVTARKRLAPHGGASVVRKATRIKKASPRRPV